MFGCSPGVRPPRPPIEGKLSTGEPWGRWECPRKLMTGQVSAWLRIHSHWSAARYWHGPSLQSWPCRDLRAMEILDSELSDWRKAQSKTGR